MNAAEVRPFWGRATAAVLATVAGLYLAGTLTLFGLLRARGYTIGLRQVAWPPALRVALPRAQAALFLRQARAAYQDGHINEALVALQSAWRDDPSNYATGLLLAQFLQAADPHGAGLIYARLRAEHPEKRPEVAQSWFYSLLTHGDFRAVATLAREELGARPDEVAWLHALIFSCRQTGDAALLETLAATPDGLLAAVRGLAATEAAALRGQLAGEELRAQLRTWPAANAPAYVWSWQIDRLLAGGWTEDALAGLVAGRGRMAGRDVAPLLLRAYAMAGDEATRAQELKTFIAARPRLNDAELTMLCAHLIRYPQADALAALTAAWRRNAGTPDTARLPLALSVFWAAAAGGDDMARREIADWMRVTAGGKLPATLDAFAEVLRNQKLEQPVTRLLPTLPPLPLEVVYALLVRNINKKQGRGDI